MLSYSSSEWFPKVDYSWMNDFLTSGTSRICFCCCDRQLTTCSASVEHPCRVVKSRGGVLWWFLTLMFYGARNHQATLGRERAKMEFNTSKFNPKPSKSFQKKNYAHWQETVFADVIILLFSVVECAKTKHHHMLSSWQAGNSSGLLRGLKSALSV